MNQYDLEITVPAVLAGEIKQKKKGKKKMSKSICMESQQYENEIRLVAKLAKEERRSLAQMTAILITEAIKAREKNGKK